jgi:A118 family predicted phage portal protein
VTGARKEEEMKESNYISDVLQRLKDLGYKPLDEDYYKYIYQWLEWFKGDVETFHKRKMFNGMKFCSDNIASLGLAKIFAQHWASLLFNNKTAVTMTGDEQNVLEELFQETNFRHYFKNTLEVTFALGTGATTEYLENGEIRVNHIYAPMIFPLKQINNEIIDCAFASIDGEGYYLNIHTRNNDGSYIIKNDWFITSNIQNKVQTQTVEKDNVVKEYVSPVKLFQIYKPNQVNTVDLYCPMGMAITAICIDQFKTADYAYSALQNEFKLGKKKIFVPVDTLRYKVVINENGQSENVPIFDENQTEFYALPGDEESKKQITEYNPNLRINELQQGIELAVNLAGMKAGFGENHFTFSDGQVYTNTAQVFSSNSDLRYNLMLHEDMLASSLKELARALYFLKTNEIYQDEITIDFDDSIFEDEQTKKANAILELNNDLIDSVQYYIDIYGMSEKQAVAFAKQLKKRAQKLEDDTPQGEEIDEEDNYTSKEENGSQAPKNSSQGE